MKLVILMLLLVMCQQGMTHYHDKLQLAVYYESKCPDSRRFITEQLVPTVNRLQDYLSLILIPFGKASSIDNGGGGFQCQHGPSECYGNKVQDCALYYMQDRSDPEKAAYVNCEMQTQAGANGSYKCVENANLPVHLIKQCVESNEGTELQLISEYATKRINPKFIPTVTINDVFNQQIQDHSQIDLLGTVCSFLKEAQPCAMHYNHKAWTHVLYKR